MLEIIDKVIKLFRQLRNLGIPPSQVILLGIIAGSAGLTYWLFPEWFRPEWIRQHGKPLLIGAVIFVFIYEAIVLVGIPICKWAWAIPNKYSFRFPGRYRKRICIDHKFFNVRGLSLLEEKTLKLEQVFVDLQISPSSNPNRPNLDPIAVRQIANARTIWDFIRTSKNVDGDAVVLVIIGPPGCGKTTLLQFVAMTLAANQQRRYKLPVYTPILLFLRDHVAAITNQPDISLGEIAQLYFSSGRYANLQPPVGWFEKQLRKGKCLVLLDGLDEVAQINKRVAVSEWVQQQLISYPRCRFVVTSRPQGYQAAPLKPVNVVEVLPFSNEQVQRFVRNWYLANEVVSAGNITDESICQRAKDGADDLLERLAGPRAASLKALTVNPLLLTMITMVHRYRGALPGSRVELYREICEVLLERWRQLKGVGDKLTADQKRLVLMPLAARMMETETREISLDEAMMVINPSLERVGIIGDVANGFLSELQASSGLILEREVGCWSFAHLTFQEYLTASYWLSIKQTTQDWATLVSNSWWHETLRLYAAQGDATPILQACLNALSLPSLTLAAEIMYEGPREIAMDVRGNVIALVEAAIESPDIDLRRLVTEVRLVRRLKLLEMIDENRQIDRTYVTCAEYQLFIDEMVQQKKFYGPDHWMDINFAAGQANEPIRGVRPEDAHAFCEWLTLKYGGNAQYRLPHTHEASRFPPSNTTLSTWCKDGSDYKLIGLSETDEAKIIRELLDVTRPSLPRPKFLSYASVCSQDYVSDLVTACEVALAQNREMAAKICGQLTLSANLAKLINQMIALQYSQDKVRASAYVEAGMFLTSIIREIEEVTRVLEPVTRFTNRFAPINHALLINDSLYDKLSSALSNSTLAQVTLLNLLSHKNYSKPGYKFPDAPTNIFDTPIYFFDLISDALNQIFSYVFRQKQVVLDSLYKDVKVEDLPQMLHTACVYMIEFLREFTPALTLANLIIENRHSEIASLLSSRNQPTEGELNSILQMLEQAYSSLSGENLSTKRSSQSPSTWLRIQEKEDAQEFKEAQNRILDLYWWLQTVRARKNKKLAAWEGIRIVRERIGSANSRET